MTPANCVFVIFLLSGYVNFVTKPQVSHFTKVHGMLYPDISESLYLNRLIWIHLKTNFKVELKLCFETK
jgi:hypothetical protein